MYLIIGLQMVRLRKWSEVEGKLTALLDEAAASHTTIRRELLSGLGRAQFHLKRDVGLALKTLEVCCWRLFFGGRRNSRSANVDNHLFASFPDAVPPLNPVLTSVLVKHRPDTSRCRRCCNKAMMRTHF